MSRGAALQPSLAGVAQLRLRRALVLLRSEAELDGLIAVRFFRADIHDRAWPSLNDGHRDLNPLVIEDAGHPDLLSDQSGHIRSSSLSRL